MIEPMLEAFADHVSDVRLQPPQIPYLSNVTGTWITAAQAMDAQYWVQHCRQTVRFADGAAALLQDPNRVLLEIGPGHTLSALARQHPDQKEKRVIASSMRHPLERQSDVAFLLHSLGQLWLSGLPVNWRSFYAHEKRRRLPLPTYPFERTRYWVEPQPRKHGADSRRAWPDTKLDMSSWFYTPSWQRSPHRIHAASVVLAQRHARWLIFADANGFGTALAHRLERLGQAVCTVTEGDRFAQLDESAYRVNPLEPADYEALIQALEERGKRPQIIVHLWSVGPNPEMPLDLERLEKALALGFYSLIFLAQALGSQKITDELQLVAVSTNMQDVTGDETLCPEKATVLGPVKIIPQEYPNVRCRSVDLSSSTSSPDRTPALVDQVLMECATPSSDLIVSYRGKHRWTQTFAPVRLDEPEPSIPRLRGKRRLPHHGRTRRGWVGLGSLSGADGAGQTDPHRDAPPCLADTSGTDGSPHMTTTTTSAKKFKK